MPKFHQFPDHQNEHVIDSCRFCLRTDGYLNLAGENGCAHLGVCLRCGIFWDAAFDLWDSWKGETEADWDKNFELVRTLMSLTDMEEAAANN